MTTLNLKTIAPALAALAFVGLWSPPARAQSNASCNLGSTSLVDSVLNPSEGEDENFLGAKNRGLPQIVFVVDGSPNMRSLPQNLDSAEVRAAGVGCSNTLLNALTYRANPCVDAKNDRRATATYDPVCDYAQGVPNEWQKPYNKDKVYLPFDYEFMALYDHTQTYIYDRGWGNDSSTATPFGTPAAACTAAGLAAGADYDTCLSCVTNSGYYLPPAALVSTVRPVLSGNWLNFNPPKYVMARRILKDQFAALDGASRNRQAMLTTVTSNARRCFSNTLGNAGMDAPRDGAEWIHASTQFKPPCDQFNACVHNGSSGGGRAGFDNAVNNADELFSSPTSSNGVDCTNLTAITGVPSGMAAAATGVAWVRANDNTCRAVYMNGATRLREAICAPYAEAVLNAGQAMAEDNLYPSLFGAAPVWKKAGITGPGTCPSATCLCSRPTIILIAGGGPDFDDNLPCQVTGNGCASIVPIDDTTGTCGAAEGAGNNLAKVTRFLAKTNAMPSDTGFPTPVNVNTFIIGIGTHDPQLVTAAEAGNGQFLEANDATELSSAINEALDMISNAELSFSNTNVTAVQTRSSTSLVVPRFTPRKKPFWPGKLALFRLFSEDACGCQKTPLTCDANQDGQCGGLFFKDRLDRFIASDSTGAFKVATLNTATHLFEPTGVDASPIWEAGAVMPSDANRKIYTVVDANNDGYFDFDDYPAGQIEFTEANAAQLAPYLNLTKDYCDRFAARIGASCLTPTDCAKQVIKYVRGFDDFDENCDGSRGDLRRGRLGDIFHSSPIIVEPPMSTEAPMCYMGISTQCLVSLTKTFGTPGGLAAYTTFLTDSIVMDGRAVEMRHRDRVILVGANDGMVHAFDFGRWVDGDDPSSINVNECPDRPHNVCPGYYTDGTGVERWGFIPPDLLPKLQRLTEGRHQFFVDGTPMVRDIWVDFNGDFAKQHDEFKTLALIGERRGGMHFMGLDVTNPLEPKFRYLFPQPNTMLARLAGESYADYLPTSPPIGPVRIKNDSSPNNYNGTRFEERWVALLEGGYDQARLRGGHINMIDAWYGSSDRLNKGKVVAAFRPGNPNENMDVKIDWNGSGGWAGEDGSGRYSFAATPGMVPFGKGPRGDTGTLNGYYFDSATIGDTGGKLWALRFNDPDRTKWSGGLAFESNATPGTQCGRGPFFQITSNVIATADNRLQTLIGSGDRFNLRDKVGGECSAQNLVACLRRGCKLEVKTHLEACDQKLDFNRKYDDTNTVNNCKAHDDIAGVDSTMAANCCSSHIEAKAEFNMKCKNSDNKDVTIKWKRELQCKHEGGDQCGGGEPGFTCEIKKETPFDICSTFDRCTTTDIMATEPRNGFYSVKTFHPEVGPRAAFNDAGTAKTYSQNALVKGNLTPVEPFVAASPVVAGSNGWYFDYSDAAPRTYPAAFGATLNAAVNERTASQATIFGACAFFSTFTPTATTSVCGADVTQGVTTRYRLHYTRGNQCSELDAAVRDHKYVENMSQLPEAPDQLMLTVRPDGMISIGLVSIPRDPGRGSGTNTTAASASAQPTMTYQVGVDRPLHECRHPAGGPEDWATQRGEVVSTGACDL